MLSLLHIENIAIIESADIRFDGGFNVLTGETGAGKSILIGFDLSVPDKDQAETMASHWKERSQEIYSYVMKTLMKG